MTSPIHHAIVEALGRHPEVLSTLLELRGSGPDAPLVPTTGTRAKALALERRVDRAFLVGSATHPKGFALVEVQLGPDPAKLFSWALYVELARSQYLVEGALVVLTVSSAVRRWIAREAARPTGQWGFSRCLSPIVIALDEIDPAHLLRADRPYLATIAVAAHAALPDAEQVTEKAINLTMTHLEKHLMADQLDAILGIANDAIRARLEEKIMEHREYRSEFFRRLHAEGMAAIRTEELAKRKAEGLAKGKAEGLARGKAEAIVAVLHGRGIPVSAAVRKQILACSEMATLDLWLQKALVASSAVDVVQAKSKPTNGARKHGSARVPRSTPKRSGSPV